MDALPEPARIEEWAPAIRLLFHYLPSEERESRCVNALHLLQRGELDPQGIFVLRGPTALRGVLVCLPVPGRSALVWPPATVEERREAMEDALLRHAMTWLRQRGVKLAQTLLAPEESFLAAPLLRNGFSAITHLGYLRHDLNLPSHGLHLPARLKYHPFADDALFRQTLRLTYEDTLDCPEVNGVRSIDEVLEGHRTQGAFDAERWWLVDDGEKPVGVLMMTEMPESGEWELAYMGVTPEARRRGFGREMLLYALRAARTNDAPAVTLSVDARNQPAWDLYRSLGFEVYDRRLVYLAIWR
jgi:mycothiol synthase